MECPVPVQPENPVEILVTPSPPADTALLPPLASGKQGAELHFHVIAHLNEGATGVTHPEVIDPSGDAALIFVTSSAAVDAPPWAIMSRIFARPAAPFVGHHEGDGSMALRSMTVHRYEEIRRRLAEGRSLREIARALGCSRRTVRDGERLSPDAPKSIGDPLWMAQLNYGDLRHWDVDGSKAYVGSEVALERQLSKPRRKSGTQTPDARETRRPA